MTEKRLTLVLSSACFVALVVFFALDISSTSVAFAQTDQTPVIQGPVSILVDTRKPTDSWQKLPGKQGWMILGFVKTHRTWWGKRKIDSWGSRVTTTFEFIDKQPFSMPKQGDRLRLTGSFNLAILDYELSRERRVGTSPAGKRLHADNDYTGVVLRSGTEVVVKKLGIAPLEYEDLWSLWALVSPASK